MLALSSSQFDPQRTSELSADLAAAKVAIALSGNSIRRVEFRMAWPVDHSRGIIGAELICGRRKGYQRKLIRLFYSATQHTHSLREFVPQGVKLRDSLWRL